MPAKPLSPVQIADAERLRKLYDAFAAREKALGRPSTQEAIAEQLHMGQSALNQYLRGKIPLGADVVLAFSDLLGIRPWDISPSVTTDAVETARRWFKKTNTPMSQGGGDWPFTWVEFSEYEALTDREKGAIEMRLRDEIDAIRMRWERASDPGQRFTGND